MTWICLRCGEIDQARSSCWRCGWVRPDHILARIKPRRATSKGKRS